MKPISKLRFDSLAGYSRQPMMPLLVQELWWFEEANEKVLGLLALDRTDNDYLYYILGRDAKGRFRAVSVECSISTEQEAYSRLERKLSEQSQMEPSSFHQGDEVGERIDFFIPVIDTDKRHPNFQALVSDRGWSPARGLLEELMHYFDNADGNFVEQFQSAAFDARLWELYLFALFTELGYGLDRTHNVPDFHCQGPLGYFFVEATTVNPSATLPVVDESNRQAYFDHYVPRKFGSALFSKLNKTTSGKRYWELPHVEGHPFVLAIQDFHEQQSMAWSSTALVEYLYGIHQVDRKMADGSVEIVSERIESHRWEGKEIPSGFFLQPDAKHFSAVIANPSGTLPKFNRMGFLAGFGDRDIRMVRKGFCYRDSPITQDFIAEVHSPNYVETWCEGLSVYHNPNAVHPLSAKSIPGAAHHFSREGRIVTRQPEFHPVGSVTMIVVPK